MKHWLALPATLLLSACMTYPPPPSAPYRAVGTEPFWSLIIDERDVTFIPAGGEPIRQPRPQPIIGIAGEIYQTPRIHVNIVHATCSDGMSDKSYSDRVQVDVDGRRFEGCGGDSIAPVGLSGTNWHIEAANGRPTPPQGEYYVRFEGDRISAKFGCNGMSGTYSENGNSLNVGTNGGNAYVLSGPGHELRKPGWDDPEPAGDRHDERRPDDAQQRKRPDRIEADLLRPTRLRSAAARPLLR